jgi:phage tail-like protein
MAGRIDPYASFNFRVEIEGVTAAGFSECHGLEASVDVIEYREGNDRINSARKLPGLVRYPHIILKRGLTQDKSLWQWFQSVVNGEVQRSNGSIVLMDAAHNEVMRWNFTAGWPSKWAGPPLNAKNNEIAIETLEIQHEGLELAD